MYVHFIIIIIIIQFSKEPSKPLAQREIPGCRHQALCPAGEGDQISQKVPLTQSQGHLLAGDSWRQLASQFLIYPKFLTVKEKKTKEEEKELLTYCANNRPSLASPPALCEGSSQKKKKKNVPGIAGIIQFWPIEKSSSWNLSIVIL